MTIIKLIIIFSVFYNLVNGSIFSKVEQFASHFSDKYEWDHNRLAPLSISKALTKSDLPKLQWILDVLKIGKTIFGNNAIVKFINKFEKKYGLLSTILKYEFDVLEKLADFGESVDFSIAGDNILTDHPTSLKQYDNLFKVIKKPESSKYVFDDDYFAFLRVGGYNPLTLKRVTALDDKFPITNAHLNSAPGFERDDLKKAIEEGRLYVADLEWAEPVKPGRVPKGYKKVVYSPIALFGVTKGGNKNLKPIAVQTAQNLKKGKIVTPKDGVEWKKAQIIFNCADANFHELVSHLGRTHLVIEAFVVATGMLPNTHPVKNILKYHLEGTALINELAVDSLIAPNGTVDKIMSGELNSEIAYLTVRAVREPGINGLFPKTFLKNQGLLDAPIEYPYRDDAIKIWDATHAWITAYVNYYYPDDNSVRSDTELQAWALNLVSDSGGRLQGLGEFDVPGKITTKWYLIDVLTFVAFQGGAQHAAVNFAQYGIMSYAPNCPTGGYLEVDAKISNPVQFLPPLSQAYEQLQVAALLGQVYYTSYGQYPSSLVEQSDELKKALDTFQKELKKIEDSIDKRNKVSKFPYPFLKPSKIPQSINI